MPMLKLFLNTPVTADEHASALAELSATVAENLGKPERYMMVSLHPETPLMFAGDTSPAAAADLASIGLSSSQTPALAAALCALIERRFAIPPDRVYITFRDVDRAFWGWNGGTF